MTRLDFKVDILGHVYRLSCSLNSLKFITLLCDTPLKNHAQPHLVPNCVIIDRFNHFKA